MALKQTKEVCCKTAPVRFFILLNVASELRYRIYVDTLLIIFILCYKSIDFLLAHFTVYIKGVRGMFQILCPMTVTLMERQEELF